MSKNVLFLILLNAVVTVLVVGVAFSAFGPAEGQSAPGDTAVLEETVERQAKEIGLLRDRLADLQELELAVADQLARLTALESGIRPAPAGEDAASAPGSPEAMGAPKEPTDAEKFAETFGNMIKQQATRLRGRVIDEIMNPTERSEARARRQIEGLVDRVAQNLDLDARDRAEVDRILTEVDRRRREKLRDIFTSKSDPAETTYEEVKVVLDESFEEEDRMIAESLPPKKAEDYSESAQPFRQMIYVGSQAAFPPADEAK